MPVYEFRCGSCGYVFDELLPLGASAGPCPHCGREGAEKLVSLVAARAGEAGGCGACGCGGACGTRAN